MGTVRDLITVAAVSVILGDFLAIFVFSASDDELSPSSMAIDARVRPLAYVRGRRLLSKNGFVLQLSQNCRTTAGSQLAVARLLIHRPRE